MTVKKIIKLLENIKYKVRNRSWTELDAQGKLWRKIPEADWKRLNDYLDKLQKE